MKKEDISFVSNTNNYKVLSIICFIISIFVSIGVYSSYRMVVFSYIIIGIGISLSIIFLVVYSICYRLDMIIEKK